MTLEYPLWKKAIILVVLVFALLYSLPNIYRQDPAVQISSTGNAVLDAATKDKVAGDLERANVAIKSIELEGDRLLVRLLDGDAQSKAAELLTEALGTEYSVALNLASTVPDWLTAMYAQKGRPPMFANRCKLSTVKQTSDSGTFFNYRIAPLEPSWRESLINPGTEDGLALLKEAKEFGDMIMNGLARADFDSVSGDDGEAAAGKGGGQSKPLPSDDEEIPF